MFLSQPTSVTIAVCDHVHLDPVTKRKTLPGVCPCVMPAVWLYVPFTGAQGMLTILLRVLSPDGEPLCEAVADVACGDHRSNYEFTAPLANLTFARPGVSVIEALADGVVFTRRELRVIAKAPAAVPLAALAPSAS
jgi:hypothetical protein